CPELSLEQAASPSSVTAPRQARVLAFMMGISVYAGTRPLIVEPGFAAAKPVRRMQRTLQAARARTRHRLTIIPNRRACGKFLLNAPRAPSAAWSLRNTTIRAAVNVFFALSSFVVELSGMLTGATCTAAKLTSVAAVKSGGAEPNGIAKANTRAGEL